MKFSEVLCGMPEVRERFNTMDDRIGIKDVFFEFIQYVRDEIKNRDQGYETLLQNMEWLEENI